ncbi:MAG: aminotransferase class V-fold PLP-dependent enzyme [Actinomycetia bacterium]|nr:aminotransferase class V-fold PLP-dependent enzyme [Actinomycetes bacterium]
MTTPRPETGRFSETFARMGDALDAWLAKERVDALRSPVDWKGRLSGPLPRAGIGADATLGEFVELVLPHGPHLTSEASWGWITTGPSTVPVAVSAASMIAAPQRQTLTSFNLLEEVGLDWLAELCGLGAHMKGVFSSGGSTANLIALGAARQWALEQQGIDPSGDGLSGVELAVYTSTQAHHTVQRSAGVLGIGRRRVRGVPVDAQMRMDTDALDRAMTEDRARGVLPVAVVAAAGTTNTGAIDPLRRCGEIAKKYGAWFHVDGAYGLPGILDERVAPLYDGLELADSAITDPHKWLNAPTGIAATFVRDRSVLFRAFTQEPADYLEGAFSDDDVQVSLDSMGVPYFDFGVELSSPARGVAVWSVLRELGAEGVRARVVQDNDFARRVAARAREHPRLELLLAPVLSICVFRYVPADPANDIDAVNREILRRLARESRFVVSSTLVHGQFALRPCFINPRTDASDVDAFVDTVLAMGGGGTARDPH